MAAHVCLKSEFTKDEKCHNLMRWLNYADILKCYLIWSYATFLTYHFYFYFHLTQKYLLQKHKRKLDKVHIWYKTWLYLMSLFMTVMLCNLIKIMQVQMDPKYQKPKWRQLMCIVRSKRLFHDFPSVFDGSFNDHTWLFQCINICRVPRNKFDHSAQSMTREVKIHLNPNCFPFCCIINFVKKQD